jgi:predicted PurR-regulated permease PerM
VSDPDLHLTEPQPARRSAFETVAFAGALVLFLFLIYDLHALDGEESFTVVPLLAAAATILVWPMRREAAVRALLMAGGLVLLIWLWQHLFGVLVPFLIIYLLAFLFEPLVRRLHERRGVPRWASALGVTGLIVGLIAGIVTFVVPTLFGEAQNLITRLIGVVGDVREWALTSPLLDRIAESGLIARDELVNEITLAAQGVLSGLGADLPRAADRIVSSLGAVIGALTILSIMPVALFYLLKDYPFIARRVMELFPTFGGKRDYLLKAGGVVGDYLRGQLIISSIAAFNVGLLLLLFGFPYAILMGLVAGVLNLIPNLGALLTMALGIVVALIFGDPLVKDLVVVVLVLLGQSLLEGSILSPTILSQQVGLHPVLILVSLFVFGYFMGMLGLFVAVPITAIVMTIYKAYRDKMHLDLLTYNDPSGSSGTTAPRAFTFSTTSPTPDDGAPDATLASNPEPVEDAIDDAHDRRG